VISDSAVTTYMPHLQRLERIWFDHPIYFVTTCTLGRQRVLADEAVHALCREIWAEGERLQHWLVGRYVIMPDHVHFFCAAQPEAKSISVFVGKWKEWTAKYANRRLRLPALLWQPGFFDHVLRSEESYEQKWEYVGDNPRRAGLVQSAADWPFQGELNDLRFA